MVLLLNGPNTVAQTPARGAGNEMNSGLFISSASLPLISSHQTTANSVLVTRTSERFVD